MKTDISNKIWMERWHLAYLDRNELMRIGLLSCMIGLIFACWHYWGNTTSYDVRDATRSALLWLNQRWQDGGDFSHGPLIPLVSLGIVWYKRKELIAAPKKIEKMGLALVVGALLLHWMGAKAQQTRVSLFALIMLSWSIPFYLCGWQVAKQLIFPCAFLIFAVPLNFLDTITFPLRITATILSTNVLNGLGIAAQRFGTAIRSMAAGGFMFDVAAPCSGLRSLIALTALTAVYAYLTQKTLVRKWILFLCSIPLAIIGNVARITTVALMAEAFGEKFAVGLYHDYSGYIVFSVAIILMIVIGGLLNTNFSEVIERWKQQA
jgi:exosortase